MRVENILTKYLEKSGVRRGFHKFLKKDRKGEKLFVFVWLDRMGDVIWVSGGRKDLVWVRFSVIGARGEGLSMLESEGNLDRTVFANLFVYLGGFVIVGVWCGRCVRVVEVVVHVVIYSLMCFKNCLHYFVVFWSNI